MVWCWTTGHSIPWCENKMGSHSSYHGNCIHIGCGAGSHGWAHCSLISKWSKMKQLKRQVGLCLHQRFWHMRTQSAASHSCWACLAYIYIYMGNIALATGFPSTPYTTNTNKKTWNPKLHPLMLLRERWPREPPCLPRAFPSTFHTEKNTINKTTYFFRRTEGAATKNKGPLKNKHKNKPFENQNLPMGWIPC